MLVWIFFFFLFSPYTNYLWVKRVEMGVGWAGHGMFAGGFYASRFSQTPINYLKQKQYKNVSSQQRKRVVSCRRKRKTCKAETCDPFSEANTDDMTE